MMFGFLVLACFLALKRFFSTLVFFFLSGSAQVFGVGG